MDDVVGGKREMKPEYVFHFRLIDRELVIKSNGRKRFAPRPSGAVTVTFTRFKEVDGCHVYRWGWGICSPLDTFCKKKGISEARKRGETYEPWYGGDSNELACGENGLSILQVKELAVDVARKAFCHMMDVHQDHIESEDEEFGWSRQDCVEMLYALQGWEDAVRIEVADI